MSLHRELNDQEIIQFKAWARENYIPGDHISEIWHPIVQEECILINTEKKENSNE
jgi:hypothetical protein